MDDLILKFLRGAASQFEERKLKNWRLAHPGNEQRFRELARLWNVPELPRSDGSEITPPSPADIMRLADERRAATARPRSARGRSRASLWAIAAAAALVVGGALARGRWHREAVGSFGAMEFATGRSETVTVTLTDGSFVRLAPQSRLRLRGPNRSRDVWLDGRAFFAVAKDSAHPFTVRTDLGTALVLGTRFELGTAKSALRLVVVEGKVALSAGGESVSVRAGEVSHVRRGSAPSVVEVANVSQLLDWPDGLLVFQSTALEQVAREIERFYHRRLAIQDSALGRRLVTAWFSDETFEEALTTVCRVSNVRCSVRDSTVAITRW
jgi:transmembrane sensor